MKFIRGASIFAFALGILLSSFAFATSEAPQGRHQPIVDLSTADGRMRFAFALLQRHPGLLQQNLSYERGLTDAMEPIPEIRSQLGDQAEPLWLNTVTRASTRYFTGSIVYDKDRLDAVTSQLTQDLEKLGIENLQDINTDLAKIRAQSVQKIEARNGKAGRESFDEKLFRKSMMRLLRLAPFLYGGDGKAMAARPNSSVIAQLTPSILDNAYNDTWKLHLKDVLRKPDQITNAVVIAFEREFIDREIVRATLARSASGSEVPRAISIEEVPAAVGIYRGCIGGDCSIKSVPYYPLIEGVSVYFIRKSHDFEARPNGYALVVKVRLGEEIIPYVVTINGNTLTESDAAAVLTLVARANGQSEVLVPDFSSVENVVNTAEMKKGMTARESRAVDAPLPKAWSIAGRYRGALFKDYYNADVLRRSRRARTDSFPVGNIQNIEIRKVANPYVLPEDLRSVAKLDRALLAIEILKSKDANQEEVLKTLQITLADAKAAQPLIERKPLDAATYQKLEDVFGHSPKQLLFGLDAPNRLETLFNLKKTEKFKNDPTIDQMIESAFRQMDTKIKTIAEEPKVESTLASYFELKERAPVGLQPISKEIVRIAVKSFENFGASLAIIMTRHEFVEKQSGYPVTEWFENEIKAAKGQQLVKIGNFLVGLTDDHPSRVRFSPLFEKRLLEIAATPEEIDWSVLTAWAIDLGSKNKTFLKKFVSVRLSEFESSSPSSLKDTARFILAVADVIPNSDPRLAKYLTHALTYVAFDAFKSSETLARLVKLQKSKVPAISDAASRSLSLALRIFRDRPLDFIDHNPRSLAHAFIVSEDLRADTFFLEKLSELLRKRTFANAGKLAEATADAKIFILSLFGVVYSEVLHNSSGENAKARALLEKMLADTPTEVYAAIIGIHARENGYMQSPFRTQAALIENRLREGFKQNPAGALNVLKALKNAKELSFALELMEQSGAKFPKGVLTAAKTIAKNLLKQLKSGRGLYFGEQEALVAASVFLLTQTGDREIAKRVFADPRNINAHAKKIVRDFAETLPDLEREQLITDLGFYRPQVLLNFRDNLLHSESTDFMEDLLVRYYSTRRSEIAELLEALEKRINHDPGSGVLWTNLDVLARIQPMPALVKRFLYSKLTATEPSYLTQELNKQAAHSLLLAGETTPEVLRVVRMWGVPKWFDPQNPTAHIPKPYAPKMSHTRNRCEAAFAQAQ